MDSGGMVSDYRGVPIAQYTIDGTFIRSYDNAATAARINGWKNILTKSRTSHGFQWVQNINYEFPAKIECAKKRKCNTILQYTLSGNYITSYSNIDSCFGKNEAHNIRCCCIGKKLSASGFQWKYKNSDKIINDISKNTKLNSYYLSKSKNEILFMYDLDGNIIKGFCCIADAEQYINKKWFKLPKRVFYHIQNNEYYNYRWTNHYYEHLPPLYSVSLSKRKPILQLDINNNVIGVYLSPKEAANAANGNANSISDCCMKRSGNKNRITSGGYKWEYMQNINVNELQISNSFLFQKITDIKSILDTLL